MIAVHTGFCCEFNLRHIFRATAPLPKTVTVGGPLLKFRQDVFQASQPVTLADRTDFVEVHAGVAPEQFENIGFGAESTRIKLRGS